MPHFDAGSSSSSSVAAMTTSTPPVPPKHRRSFSGIRTSFGLSSSPSLPIIANGPTSNGLPANPSMPAFHPTQTPSRPSLPEDYPRTPSSSSVDGHARKQSFGGIGLGTPITTSKNTLPTNIRSLRTKFSFGSPSLPISSTPRSASYNGNGISNANGNGNGGSGFMARLPFATLSKSAKHKMMVSTPQSPTTELVSPFSTPTASNMQSRETIDDSIDGPVMQISAFPPSPGSIMSDHSLHSLPRSGSERHGGTLSVPTSPSPSPASPNSPYYPPVLGQGLPRTSTPITTASLSRTNSARMSTETFLAPPSSQNGVWPDDRTPSPSRSLRSLQGMYRSVCFRTFLALTGLDFPTNRSCGETHVEASN